MSRVVTLHALERCGRRDAHAPHDYAAPGAPASCPGIDGLDAAPWVLCSVQYAHHEAVRVRGLNDIARREYTREGGAS